MLIVMSFAMSSTIEMLNVVHYPCTFFKSVTHVQSECLIKYIKLNYRLMAISREEFMVQKLS